MALLRRTPMATSTCDGSHTEDVQALPALAAMPARPGPPPARRLHAVEGEVSVVGQPRCGWPLTRPGDAVRMPSRSLAQAAAVADVGLRSPPQAQGDGRAHDAGDVLSAGASLPLLAAAGQLRQEGGGRVAGTGRRRPSARRTCAPTG